MADGEDDWRSLLESSWKSADKKLKISSPRKATDSAVTASGDEAAKSSSASTSAAAGSNRPGLGRWSSLLQKTQSEDASSATNATPAAADSAPACAEEDEEEDWRKLLDASWSKAAKPARVPAPAVAPAPKIEKSTSRSSFGSWTRILSQPSLETVDGGCDASSSIAAAKKTIESEAPPQGASAAKAHEEEDGDEVDLGSFLSAAFTKAKSAPKVVIEEVVINEEPTADEVMTATEAAAEEDAELEVLQDAIEESAVDAEMPKADDIEEPAADAEMPKADAVDFEEPAVDAEMQMAAAALLEEMNEADGEETADVEVMDAEDVTAEEGQETAVDVGDDKEEPTSANRAAAWQADLDKLSEEEEEKEQSQPPVVDLEEDLEENTSEGAAEEEAKAPEASTKIMILKGKASGAAPANKKTALPKFNSGDKALKCPDGHQLSEFKVEGNGFSCDRCKKSIQKGVKVHGCRPCDYDLCSLCVVIMLKPGQGKGAQKGWVSQAKHGGSWGPKPPGSPPGQSVINAWNSNGKQQSHSKVHHPPKVSGPLARANSAPAKLLLPQKITPIKPVERANSGELNKQNSGRITPIKPSGNSNSILKQQSSGNLNANGLKRQRTDDGPIAARDAEGRQYDLKRIVVNFANVGATYATKVLKRDQDQPKWLFDWEGVRRCVQHLTKNLDIRVVGVIYENFWATDRDSKDKKELPQDIRRMCESVEETPRLTGQCHSSADDEMTIKCAYHRNCRFMDNDNYRDWKQQLRDERCRSWLDQCQDLLQMRYYFDSGVGCFETLDGNIPPGLLAPDQGKKHKVTKQALWTAPNR